MVDPIRCLRALIGVALLAPAGGYASSCADVDSCIAVLAQPESTPGEVSTASDVLSRSASSTRPNDVLNLLAAPTRRVRSRAARIAVTLPLRPEHLPWLVRAAREGVPDLELTIAKLARDTAATTLRDILLSGREVDAVAFALSLAEIAPRDADALAIALLACRTPCSAVDSALIARTILLRAVANDVARHRWIATEVLGVIEDSRVAAADRATAAQLYAELVGIDDLRLDRARAVTLMQSSNPAIALPFAHAFARYDDPVGLKLLIDALPRDPVAVLASFAALGTRASAAAPRVTRLLNAGELNAALAIRTLGAMSGSLACRVGPPAAEHADPAVLIEFLSFAASLPDPACRLWLKRPPAFWHPGLDILADILEAQTNRSPGDAVWLGGAANGHTLPQMCGSRRAPDERVLTRREPAFDSARLRSDADLDWQPRIALLTTHGWFASVRDAKGRSRLWHIPPSATRPALIATASEISDLFEYRGEIYVIATRDTANAIDAPVLMRVLRKAPVFELAPVIHLPAQVDAVYANRSDDLILALGGGGYVDLTDTRRPVWLGCDYPMSQPSVAP